MQVEFHAPSEAQRAAALTFQMAEAAKRKAQKAKAKAQSTTTNSSGSGEAQKSVRLPSLLSPRERAARAGAAVVISEAESATTHNAEEEEEEAEQRLAALSSQPTAVIFGSAHVFDVCVRATASDVAVITTTPVIQFQLCVTDRLYRSVCVLQNRGPTALKCQVLAPAKWSQWIEFTPSVGYLQKQSTMEVQIKFTPDLQLLKTVYVCGFVRLCV